MRAINVQQLDEAAAAEGETQERAVLVAGHPHIACRYQLLGSLVIGLTLANRFDDLSPAAPLDRLAERPVPQDQEVGRGLRGDAHDHA